MPGAGRAIIPLFDDEVRGVSALGKVLRYAFTADRQPAGT